MFREEEVRRGIALLDEQEPGWREKFNPETLKMEGSSTCVLGQVYGFAGYIVGMVKLCSTPQRAEECGFARKGNEPMFSPAFNAEYKQLGETWKTLVPLTAYEQRLDEVIVEKELVLV